MKMLTVCLFVWAMMALTRATAPLEAEDEPGTEDEPRTEQTAVEFHTDADSWTDIPFTAAPLEAEDEPGTEDEPRTEQTAVEFHTDADSWTDIPFTAGETGGWVPSCPAGWTMFDIRCLLYVPKNMTWTQAKENCQSLGGSLAFVYTEYYDEILKVTHSAGHENGEIWVGNCNRTEDDSWTWRAYDWFAGTDEREHNCFNITSAENELECKDEKQCDAQLPSVCSILIM